MTKILVIDDETILREEIVDWLTFEGYDAADAENGLVGVEYATRNLPDLVICDITMPHLDGLGVLLELHANAATNIPLIFVTARAAYEDIRQGMTLGADDYITKPFSRLEFLQAVQTRLEKRVRRIKSIRVSLISYNRLWPRNTKTFCSKPRWLPCSLTTFAIR